MTKTKRKHQLAEEAKATPEKGGGKRYVEELSGRSINELYARLLASGELARAGINKHQTHGTKEEVIKMLENAKPVPAYMTNSQIKKVEKEIEEQTEKIKKLTKKDLITEKLKTDLKNLKEENEIKLLRKEIEFQSSFKNDSLETKS